MSWRFWEPDPMGLLRTVIVNRKSDPETAIKGILWQRCNGFVVLKDAYYLVPQRQPEKIDGEIVIERSNIDFIQLLP